MRHVWLNGSNYITSSTEIGYQLFYMSSPGQGAVNSRNLICETLGIDLSS
jgi:hypothetical protein